MDADDDRRAGSRTTACWSSVGEGTTRLAFAVAFERRLGEGEGDASCSVGRKGEERIGDVASG